MTGIARPTGGRPRKAGGHGLLASSATRCAFEALTCHFLGNRAKGWRTGGAPGVERYAQARDGGDLDGLSGAASAIRRFARVTLKIEREP